ncbi:hypothetical protein [Pseudorhodoplanes sp.]|uniref:hypothetical protein n=1 Tax=Pseudorhodoplanes sp. TaxID=1934341 RepID=UPI003918E660
MTIYRKVKGEERAARMAAAADQSAGPGMLDARRDRMAVADTSYQSDALAQLIVDAWVNKNNFGTNLLNDRAFVKAELQKRGIFLENPVVIREDQYWSVQGYTQDDDNEVVFVLPDEKRVATNAPQHSLLETAKLLMACVPNGI